MAALIVFLLFVALAIAVVLGRSPDTRDPEFSTGRLLAPRRPDAPAPTHHGGRHALGHR